MRLRSVSLPLLAALALACSSDLPTELTAPAHLQATELGLRANVAPYSRSALFREAVERVATAEGMAALWSETAELRRHASAARSARARGDIGQQLAAERAHRQAQLQFSASALGDARIDDVHREVRLALAATRARVVAAQATGRDVTRAALLVEEASAALADDGASPVAILAGATAAADVLDRADQLLQAVNRIPSIDDLFAAALSDVRREAGGRAARALLSRYQTLVREAEHALGADDRMDAQARLQAVRSEQVRIVAERLGSDGVRRHVSAVRTAERSLAQESTDVRRSVARDKLTEAATALQRGDIERALERATLAGEIVNALRAEGSAVEEPRVRRY